MLAMDYRGPYRVRLSEKPMPRIEHPRDAVVLLTRGRGATGRARV